MEEKKYDPYTGEEIKEPVEEVGDQAEQAAVQSEPVAEQTESEPSPDTIVVGKADIIIRKKDSRIMDISRTRQGHRHMRLRRNLRKTIMRLFHLCLALYPSHWHAAVFP